MFKCGRYASNSIPLGMRLNLTSAGTIIQTSEYLFIDKIRYYSVISFFLAYLFDGSNKEKIKENRLNPKLTP